MNLVLLDKDGTLVRSKSGGFVQRPSDQEPLPGVRKCLSEIGAAQLIITSNQGGVAAGYKSLEDAIAEMQYCLSLFSEISAAFFCPDFKGNSLWLVRRDRAKECSNEFAEYKGSFRKPKAGMLWAAQEWKGINARLMIGDRPEDEGAAIAAGIPFLDAKTWRAGWPR